MKPWVNTERVRAAARHDVLHLIAAQPIVASERLATLKGRTVPVPGARCPACGRGMGLNA